MAEQSTVKLPESGRLTTGLLHSCHLRDLYPTALHAQQVTMSALCNAVTCASKVMRGRVSVYDIFAAVPRICS